ncbi:putative aminopeptidase YtoP [Bienertia sinuspersici]
MSSNRAALYNGILRLRLGSIGGCRFYLVVKLVVRFGCEFNLVVEMVMDSIGFEWVVGSRRMLLVAVTLGSWWWQLRTRGNYGTRRGDRVI